ncbi:Phenylalanine--tRNA ligase beta subunit [Budvicia aquatica]|uniref:Phenylalanine--tRNA ligase beta subunit n=1 Tax=Budvicia aquatica TaxID=82979 RepID=A0A484ZUW2_9GAMM|nr:Phenylalanine--tRNA ligase beta subunit [Budvicia aquatica]
MNIQVLIKKLKMSSLSAPTFNPLAIAGRARRFGLHTDASHRYERGVDPALQERAIERATRLLLDICGGQAGPVIDVTDKTQLPKQATITLRRQKLDKLIGYVISDEQVADILTRLGCKVTNNGDSWTAVAPTWRFDMQIEEIWLKKSPVYMAITAFRMYRYALI